MAALAKVAGRPDGAVFMGRMVTALQLEAFAEVPDDLVLTEPGWTFFSVDFAADEAVFLDIGAETDVSSAPFSYQRQFETARRVIRLKLHRFLELGERTADGPPLAHVFNIGHCGSTLLHHVFNRSGQAWCLSEPLFTFDLAMNRAALSRDRLTALLRVGFRMLRHFPAALGRLLVVKHFSQTTTIISDCVAAEPGATCLFLYRQGQAWCNSLYGFHQRLGGKLALSPEERLFSWKMMSADTPLSHLAGLVDMAAPEVTFDSLAAVAWSLHLQHHARAKAEGTRMFSLRYEDLTVDRAGVLAGVFDHCGLPQEGVMTSLAAFDEDSHRGAATARSQPVEPLSEIARSRVLSVFAKVGVTGHERLT